jgi:hypothetical protein
MHRTIIAPKYYCIVNQRVKIHKIKSSKFAYQVHEIIFSYNNMKSSYVIDNLYGASMEVDCPVGVLKIL